MHTVHVVDFFCVFETMLFSLHCAFVLLLVSHSFAFPLADLRKRDVPDFVRRYGTEFPLSPFRAVHGQDTDIGKPQHPFCIYQRQNNISRLI